MDISGSAAQLALEAAAEEKRKQRVTEEFQRAKGVLGDELRRREESGEVEGTEADVSRIKVLSYAEVQALKAKGELPFVVTTTSITEVPTPILKAIVTSTKVYDVEVEGNENDL